MSHRRSDKEIQAGRERRRMERRRDQPKAQRAKGARGRYRKVTIVEAADREAIEDILRQLRGEGENGDGTEAE
jgi:hypothetical protein